MLYGWKVNVRDVVKQLRALRSSQRVDKGGENGHAGGSLDHSCGSEGKREFDCQCDDDDSGFEDENELECLLQMLAEPADIRVHLSVVNDIIWLSRNYLNPRGRIYGYGLLKIPDDARINKFSERLGLEAVRWIALKP